MPMTNDHRRTYLHRAGATQKQIDEFVGELPLHEESVRAHGVPRADAEKAREQIRQLLADAAIIAAKYSAVAKGEPGAAAVQADERENDRKFLDELFADEYALVNPFGEQQDKAEIIEGMLSGTIQYDGMGSAGFESAHQSLRVHGDAAVAVGEYRLKGHGRARNLDTGAVHDHDLTGSYRITNNYVFRDSRWQASHSQMTQIPSGQRLSFTPERRG